MEHFVKNTFQVSRSYTYTYYKWTPEAAAKAKPTLLLLHGFCDDAHLWQDVVPGLLELDFPLLVPDLLGYSGTSKPAESSAYNYKSMVGDIAEILEFEHIDKIVSVGHDWGSGLAQRVYNFRPDLVVGLIILSLAYVPPTLDRPFDLEKTLQGAEKLLGYPNFAYWELFSAADGPAICDANVEGIYDALHGGSAADGLEIWCSRGGMRKFLTSNRTLELPPYAKDPRRKAFIERLKRDGMTGPLQWYAANVNNDHYKVEKDLSPDRLVVRVPTLYIACSNELVCKSEMINKPRDAGLLPHLVIKEIESGHFCPMEAPYAVQQAMMSYLKEKF